MSTLCPGHTHPAEASRLLLDIPVRSGGTLILMSRTTTAPQDDPRTLHVDGLVNARDLGALRRRDGSTTPAGVFYRSENIDRITPVGWSQVFDTGIRTVVDLRQPGERAQDTNPRPSWLMTIPVDLDGPVDTPFWADYWDNGLCGTALYYLPHLRALPERSVAALSAIVNAPAGGVLFHCASGRDRTGLIALLLLTAIDTDENAIVDDYLYTVRLSEVRAVHSNRTNEEPLSEALCHEHGTTTEGAFRDAAQQLDLHEVLRAGRMADDSREALRTWRGHVARVSLGSA